MKKTKLTVLLSSIALALGVFSIVAPKQKEKVSFAYYPNGDAATYYNTIDDTQSGNTLLTALRTLNLSKRQSTVGYSSMGTTPSGMFKYTDYDPNYVQYDSNGQPYGTRISSFYTYTSATSWNREHVWPNSHGGGSGGDAGSPYPDADIHMPRPTISSENSSRGNSFFVEGMNHSSNGWDPYTAGYSAESRGEAARITFYSTLVNSKLILAPNNTTPSGTDSVTGQSFGSGHTMGNLETLIKWNINYPVTQRERNRNEGAEYLQGNRNAFVDHPEYACKIWGNVNNNIKNMCASASWDTGNSVTISKSSASLTVDDTTTINATASDNSTITWTTSDATVADISTASSASGANITITAIGPGTATITARATIGGNAYTATCAITVTSAGGGGGGGDSGDSAEGSVTASNGSLSGWTSVGAGSAYNDGSVRLDSTGDNVYKLDIFSGDVSANMTSLTVTVNSKINGDPNSSNSYKVEALDSNGNVLTNDTQTGANIVTTNYGDTVFTLNSNLSGCTGIRITYAKKGSGNWGIKSVSWSATYSGSSTEKTVSSISVKTAPTKTTYLEGETFNPAGLVIHVSYSDNTSEDIAYSGHESGFDFDPDLTTPLSTIYNSISIYYGDAECSQAITVNAKTLTSISISSAPTKTTYYAGDIFDPTGLVITRHYNNNTSDTYTYSGHTSEFSFSPSLSTALTTSNTSITITYSGKSTTQNITVSAVTLSSISVGTAPTKTTYTEGEYFDPTGLVITRNYNNSTSDTYTYSGHTSEFTFTPSTSTALTTSNTSVTITYGGKSTTQPITVNSSGGGLESKSVTINFGTGGNCTANNGTFDGVSFSTATEESNNAPIYNSNSHELRMYFATSGNGNTFTLNPDTGYKITGVTITASSTNYTPTVKYYYDGGSLYTGLWSSTTMSITSFEASTLFVFKNANTDNVQLRIKTVVVDLEPIGGSSAPTLSSVTVDTAPTKLTYVAGEYFDPTGLIINRYYSDNSHDTYTYVNHVSEFEFDPDTSTQLTTSHISVTISYGNKTTEQAIVVSSSSAETISASVDRTFYVGETIHSTDIIVVDSDGYEVDESEFILEEYTFTYDDAPSGGAVVNKTFANAIHDLDSDSWCDLVVPVARKPFATSKTDVLTADDLAAEDTSYTDFSNVTKNSDAVYNGLSARDANGNIQLRTKNGGSGICTSISGGTVVSVSITIGSGNNSIEVYGKNTSYSSYTDLFDDSKKGTLVGQLSVTGTITLSDSYQYIGIRSSSGAVYISSIEIVYGSSSTAENVANYIMFEDSNNQCLTKFDSALEYLSGLSESELSNFQTSNDYIILTARTRLEAWAAHLGRTINYETNNVTASAIKNLLLTQTIVKDENTITIILVVISALAISAGYYLYRKRKHD